MEGRHERYYTSEIRSPLKSGHLTESQLDIILPLKESSLIRPIILVPRVPVLERFPVLSIGVLWHCAVLGYIQ